ncbi:hypothetical protein ACJX0J_026022 [Zea mays]
MSATKCNGKPSMNDWKQNYLSVCQPKNSRVANAELAKLPNYFISGKTQTTTMQYTFNNAEFIHVGCRLVSHFSKHVYALIRNFHIFRYPFCLIAKIKGSSMPYVLQTATLNSTEFTPDLIRRLNRSNICIACFHVIVMH